VLATGLHTNLIAALDLSLIVPLGGLAAVWLWSRRAAGTVLAAIWSVQGAVYMSALAAATFTSFRAGHPVAIEQAALWGGIGLGCSLSSWRLLRDLTGSVGSVA
jgi:hypothetical protein